jgi:hypothetical protein
LQIAKLFIIFVYEKKKCIYCSIDFEYKSNKAKYCSNKCRTNYLYKNHKNHKLLCKQCGIEFNSQRNDLNYCSKKCAGKSKQNLQILSIEDLINFIKNNDQISISKVVQHFKCSNRTVYNLLKSNGYYSYKEFIGFVKGIYLEKIRTDTSINAVSCFEYCKTLLNCDYKTEISFENLINPKTNRNLRVDCFFEKLNIIIEYNGIQHYKQFY